MALNAHGTWYSRFISPAKGDHRFTLDLNNRSGEVTGKMHLSRHDAKGGKLDVNYRVHVEMCGRFVALLAKDSAKDSLGMNAMVLEVSDDASVMHGRIIWNSMSSNTVEGEKIEWNKKPPIEPVSAD
jgi:hypothetical protein